jgi:hypothetical protein
MLNEFINWLPTWQQVLIGIGCLIGEMIALAVLIIGIDRAAGPPYYYHL